MYQSPLSLPGQPRTLGTAPVAPLADKLPLACDPDLAEMLSVLCVNEVELQPSASYLEDQHGPRALPELYLDASMRRTAVSWLVEVTCEFRLHNETLWLAISLLDRFLSASKVGAGQGCASTTC